MDTASNLNVENGAEDSRSLESQEDEVVKDVKTIVRGFLMKLVTSSLGMICCFSLVGLNVFYKFDFSVIFVPFVLIEAGLAFVQIFKLAFFENKKWTFCQLLLGLFDMVFWIFMIIYMKSKGFPVFLLMVPVTVSGVFLVFQTFKVKYSICRYLMIVIFRLCLALLVFSAGLKKTGVISCSWKATIWPVWVMISFFFLGSAVALGRLITSTVRFIYIGRSKQDLFSSLWFFYLTTGGGSSGTVFMLLPQNSWKSLLPLQIYLIPLVLFSIFMYSQLLSWIVQELYSPSPSRTVQRQPQSPSRSSSEEKSLLAFFPPVTLERITSTYFKPCAANFKGRTMSEVPIDDSGPGHIRSCTLPIVLESEQGEECPAIEESESSFINKKCSICFEHECNAVFLPCGHGGICIQCSGKLVGIKKKCVICRAFIEKVLKIEVKKEKVVRVVGIGK